MISIASIKIKAKYKFLLPVDINPKLPLFIAVGRLVKQKGVDRLINWFSNMKVSSNLLILGDGPNKIDLEKQIHNLGMHNRIKLLGFLSNPYPLIFKSNALLISSRWEGFPNVALESLILGTPVIATEESGGLIDIAKKVDRNYLRIAKNKEDFISLMDTFAKNDKKRKIISPKLPLEFNQENIKDIFRKMALT